jgi:hypothetical protein
MKKLIISEAQFVSLFDKPQNKDENSRREKLCDMYLNMHHNDQKEMLHKLAFTTTMKMTDNGEKLPEFGDNKLYNSIYGKKFSPKQVAYVEKNIIYPQYGNMSPRELAYVMADNSEQNEKDDARRCKEAVAKLYSNGFFDKYLNGMAKDLALWDMGKLNDVSDYIGWLYTKNRFLGKLNRSVIYDDMGKRMDEIADSDEAFMKNDIFLAFNELKRALGKLNRKG